MTYIAWVDDRNGNNEIYVARSNGSQWEQLLDSASKGGVSDSDGDSRRPTLHWFNGNLIVGWTEITEAGRTIQIASSGEGWAAPAGGPMVQGTVDFAKLTESGEGYRLFWLQVVGGNRHVFTAELVDTGASVTWSNPQGITNVLDPNADVIEFDADGGTRGAAIAWSTESPTGRTVEVASLEAGSWGIRGTFSNGTNTAPTVAIRPTPESVYDDNGAEDIEYDLFIAMEQATDDDHQIVAYRQVADATGWQSIDRKYSNESEVQNGPVIDSTGYPSQPQFAASIQNVVLAWLDDNHLGEADGQTDIYTMASGLGATLFEGIEGYASGDGISLTGGGIRDLELVNQDGLATVSWTETSSGTPRIYARKELVSDALLEVQPVSLQGLSVPAVGKVPSDPDVEIQSATIDWGDGVTELAIIEDGFVTGEHVYNTTGVYPVSLTLVDVRGRVYTDSSLVNIKIDAASPVVQMAPPDPLEVSPVRINGLATDDAAVERVEVSISNGIQSWVFDATLETPWSTVTLWHYDFVPNNTDTYTIFATVFDLAGNQTSTSPIAFRAKVIGNPFVNLNPPNTGRVFGPGTRLERSISSFGNLPHADGELSAARLAIVEATLSHPESFSPADHFVLIDRRDESLGDSGQQRARKRLDDESRESPARSDLALPGIWDDADRWW